MKKQAILLLILCVACGKTANKKDSAIDTETDLSEVDFVESLPNQKLEAPKDPTPPPATNPLETQPTKAAGVGVLTVITKSTETTTYAKNCTATVINGDELITAAHCVPKSENGPQDYCSKMHFLHSSEAKVFTCSKVLWSSFEMDKASSKTFNTPDILILKLNEAPQNIRSYKLEENFANNDASYKTLLYSPNEMDESKTQNSELLKAFKNFNFVSYKECKFTDGSLTEYPFRTFDCPIVGGNSGGPFINSKNKLQGIIGGCRDTKGNGTCTGIKEEGGYMTDVACLEKVNGEYQWKDSCATGGTIRAIR